MKLWSWAALAIAAGWSAAAEDVTTVKHTETPLSETDAAYLEKQGWDDRVEDGLGIWVSVEDQTFRLVQNGQVLWSVPCSTAANGTGSQSGSKKTPLGWHVVSRKIGADAPLGQIFRGRAPTKEIWEPGDDTTEDLVLTRILILDGLEPGKNKGGNVDSRKRYIYIHGTNDEAKIGTPASHGCIRLRNEDVVNAFDRIPEETPMLISERTTAPEE
jgi:hypothetical protein